MPLYSVRRYWLDGRRDEILSYFLSDLDARAQVRFWEGLRDELTGRRLFRNISLHRITLLYNAFLNSIIDSDVVSVAGVGEQLARGLQVPRPSSEIPPEDDVEQEQPAVFDAGLASSSSARTRRSRSRSPRRRRPRHR